MVARTIHGKYGLHLPLYRQIKEFERLGRAQRRSDGQRAAADAMEPLWKAMHSLLLESPVLHVDETAMPESERDERLGGR